MNIYVVNLREALDRKNYIKKIFNEFQDYVSLHFVEAIDGRKMSPIELNDLFMIEGAFNEYGRYLKGAEIGCTESHRKCCETFLKDGQKSAMIIEDDLVLRTDSLPETITKLENYLDCEDPKLVLLSGDYWYSKLKKYNGITLASVREAVSSHAYVLNRRAAELILKMDNNYLADDWFKYKQAGIKVYALYPHIADQNFRDYSSSITEANSYMGIIRRNLSFTKRVYSYYRAVIKHILYYAKHFEHRNHLM